MKALSILFVSLLFCTRSVAGLSESLIDSLANEQPGFISGQVLDKDSDTPLIGVNITIQDTRRGAISNQQGNFRIPAVQAGHYTIVFEYIGYKREKLENVIVKSGQEA